MSSPGVKAVFRLFRPYRGVLLLAQLFFVIKHSPVWILPILTADLIHARLTRWAVRRIECPGILYC